MGGKGRGVAGGRTGCREDVGSGQRAQRGEQASSMEPLPCPLSICDPGRDLGNGAHARLPVWLRLPLVPILAVGTRAGHAAPLLPRLGLSSQGLLHLQLDLGGAQPTDGQVVPRNVLHRQLLLPCGEPEGVVCSERPEGAKQGA